MVKWKDKDITVSISTAPYYGYYYYDIPINTFEIPTGSVLVSVYIVNVPTNYPSMLQIVNNAYIRINCTTRDIDTKVVTIRTLYKPVN